LKAIINVACFDRYAKGWKYHAGMETWFNELTQVNERQFNCRYFNVNKFEVVTANNLEVSPEELTSIEEFRASFEANNPSS
jgi:hypothetical protein